MNYRVEGVGPPVLLLPAVGLDLTFLEEVSAGLSKDFAVMRADLRGHGETPWQIASGLADYADDVHALLDKLGFAPAAIVGFAFGGMVAQQLAIKYPQDVSALVIASCPSAQTAESKPVAASRGTDALRHGIASILDVTMQRWFNDDFLARGGDAAARKHLLTADVRAWADGWNAIANINTAPKLGTIRAPTLCLAGEHDKSAPPPIVKATADAIPGARFAVIPGGSHMLFIEHPAETIKVVGDFLKEALG